MEALKSNDSANQMIHIDQIKLKQKYSDSIKQKQSQLPFANENSSVIKDSNFMPLQSQQPLRRYADYRAKTTVGFQRADYQKAKINKISRWNRYHKGQQVPYTIDIEYFKAYGPGIYLFFVYLKQLTIVFFIMSIIALIPIIYNVITGTNLSNVGTSVQTYIAWTTVGNQKAAPQQATYQQHQQQLKHKLMNVIPDIISSLIFVIFYFYWSWKSTKLVKQVQKEVKLLSHQTVQLTQFPQDASQQEIEAYMARFGIVQQVAPVKDYQDMIFYSQKIYELSLQLKQIRLTQGPQSDTSQKVLKKVADMDQLSQKLRKQEQNGLFKVLKYYIVYDSQIQRETILETFRPYNSPCFCCKKVCCGQIPPQQLHLNGILCKVQPCHVQPGQILWENGHITWRTRWLRYLIQLLFVLSMITLGFLFISFLNISSPPLDNSNIDTSSYNSTSIQTQTNMSIVQSWCLKNNNAADLPSICNQFIKQYYYKIAITVGISLVIVIVRFIVKIIVISLAKFQRYNSITQQTRDIMMNLFITYVCTTVLITILLQANLFGVSFKRFAGLFISEGSVYKENLNALIQYDDLIGTWYIDIGYQLFFTWLILAFSPHCFWPFVQYLRQKLGQYMAKKQVLQKNVQNWIEAQQFDISDHYANIMMVIFVALLFSGGIPLLIPLSFFALLTRYISFKYSFIRFSRIPKTYDESLDFRVSQIMAAAIILHYAFSIWIFGVNEIFAPEQTWLSTLINSTSSSDVFLGFYIALQRIGQYWYLTVILGIAILTIIFKSFLFDLIIKFCCNKQKQIPKENSSKLQFKRTQISLTSSYKLQNNPDYFQILAIMNPKLVQRNISNIRSRIK